MSAQTSGDLADIVAFNRAVLGQALALLNHHDARPDIAFREVSGPHLRHVIEHYEAMLHADAAAPIGYDARVRDADLERDAARARERILALMAQLGSWSVSSDAPVTTVLRAGLDGGIEIASRSSVGRELMFLACHAIHHYALIERSALSAGLTLPDGFGKAPSTVHHEARRALQVAA